MTTASRATHPFIKGRNPRLCRFCGQGGAWHEHREPHAWTYNDALAECVSIEERYLLDSRAAARRSSASGSHVTTVPYVVTPACKD